MPLGPTDKQKKNILIKMERERVLQLITKKQEKKTLILKGKNKVNSDDNIVPSQFNRVKYLNNIIKSQDKKEDIFNNRLYKNFYYLISKKKVNINLKNKKNKSQEIFNTINISDNINNIKNHLLFNLPSLLVNKISYNLPN